MKKSLFVLSAALSLSLFSLEGETTIIADTSGLEILTPALQTRKTAKLRLHNGLQAYLISDPNTPESGAAIAVGVGSWDDPEERPGMAHFVEHLLFLGTEKYPEESGYSRFLDEHGGKQNAFTASDRTVYIFSCEHASFIPALDRFAEFFISPLFNPSGVARELKAINQEFARDVMLEYWRALHVKKELSNAHHPFHRFDIGNEGTLKTIAREELIEWVNTHYSSDLMHLVVVSPLSLEELEEEVASRFGKIEKRDVNITNPSVPIVSSKTENAILAISPLHETRSLELSWEIPLHLSKDQDVKPEQLISYVLGHEGETSLLAKLKKQGLALNLATHNYHAGKNQSFLSLTVELTEAGVQNVLGVIEECHRSLATLQHYGIPRYIFDESQKIAALGYTFQNRSKVYDEVSEYAYRLAEEELETFPLKSLMPTLYDPQKIDAVLSSLTPQTCRYTMTAPLPEITWKKEKWMGVNYTVIPLSEAFLSKLEKIERDPAFALPRPNRFLPESLYCKEVETDHASLLPRPQIIADKDTGKIYHALDDRFGLPEICWQFLIKTPAFKDSNAKTLAAADLYCKIVKHRLNHLAYEAELGGLEYSLLTSNKGIGVVVKGYKQKAEAFLAQIIDALASVTPTIDEFSIYKDQLKRHYHNQCKETPLKLGSEFLKGILYKNYNGPLAKLEAISDMTFKELERFRESVFENAFIEGVFFGDSSTDLCKEISLNIEDKLIKGSFPSSEHPKIELADFKNLLSPSYLEFESPLDGNALILTIDCGPHSYQKEAALTILSKGLEEPFFSELRTKQQTAYVVGNYAKEMEDHLFAFFAIQSSSHATRDLLSRFELFIENSLMHLSSEVIDEKRFESIKSAMLLKLRTPEQTPSEMAQLLSELAFDYDGDFERIHKKIDALENLTYADFLKMAIEFLGKDNQKRIAVCVEGNLSTKNSLSYRKVPSLESVSNFSMQKKR